MSGPAAKRRRKNPDRAPATDRYRVPAAARVIALLEFLADEQAPVGVSEAARRTGIPKSSCFALITTLEQAGYVRRNEKDEWALTLRLYHLGLDAARNADIQRAARPVLRLLCDETELTAHLGLFDGTSMIYAEKAEPPGEMVRFDTYPGKPASAHLTAIGRAVAASMSPADLQTLLAGYEFVGGDNPRINSREDYEEELARVRRRGYAVEREEENTGVVCVAAPVVYASGAAVGVAALAGQIQERGLDAVSSSVIAAARRLSKLLGEEEREP